MARAARAARTWAAYRAPWQRWVAFTRAHGFEQYTSNGAQVALFLAAELQSAAQRNVGAQAIEQASASITAHYGLVGRQTPCLHPACHDIREAARRTLTAQHRSREPLTAADMTALVCHHLKPGCSLRTRMHVTVAVLCFAGQLRFSDAAAIMVHHGLMRLLPDRAELMLWSSKTDQRGDGAMVIIGRTRGPTCPVALLEQLLAAGGYQQQPRQDAAGNDMEDVGPLLRAVQQTPSGSERLRQVSAPLPQLVPPLAYTTFSDSLLALLRAAGVTKPVGTHSLRIGGTTAAIEAGAPPLLVKQSGRWRSDAAFEGYVRPGAATRAALTRAILPPLSAEQ
jgi:hypothetical protein